MKNKSATIFQTLLLATFAVWFGGFTFYVSFVVPIGTDVLGSARSQGMITQQVTNWLNLVCGIATLMMLLESFRSWKLASRSAKYTQLAMVALIGGLLVGLLVLHPYLDALVDLEKERVIDRTKFYGLHRVYLWLSTFQWIAAWIWLIVFATGLSSRTQLNTENPVEKAN